MEERIKQRLIGVLVLIGALFIILPFLFHNSRPMAESKLSANTSTMPSVSLPVAPENTASSANSGNQPSQVNASVAPAEHAANNTANPNPSNSASNTVNANNTPAPQAGSLATAVNNPSLSVSVAQNTTQIPAAALSPPASAQPAIAVVTNTSALTSPSANIALTTPVTSVQTGVTNAAPTPSTLGPSTAVTTGKINPPFQTTADASSVSSSANVAIIQPVAQTTPDIASAPAIQTSLKHTAIAVNKPASSAHAKKAWTVQLAAFSDRNNAEALMRQLRHHQFAVYTRTIKHNQRTIMLVFVGPETNAQRAHLAQRRLQRDFQLNGIVRKYQS